MLKRKQNWLNMASDYYSLIRSIEADKGEVIIVLTDCSDSPPISITVDEALDRAEALKTLTLENTLRHRQVREIYDAFIGAAVKARAQQAVMSRNGEFVDFRLKERHRRKLELQRFKS